MTNLVNSLKNDPSVYNKVKNDSIKIKECDSFENGRKSWDKYYKDVYEKYPNKHKK